MIQTVPDIYGLAELAPIPLIISPDEIVRHWPAKRAGISGSAIFEFSIGNARTLVSARIQIALHFPHQAPLVDARIAGPSFLILPTYPVEKVGRGRWILIHIVSP